MEGYTNFTNLHAEVIHGDKIEADELSLTTKSEAIADIATDANGKAIATAVNGIIAALVDAGIIEEDVEEDSEE